MHGVPERLLVENAKRYSIGDRTPGLKVAPDGSLTLCIQSTDPGGDKTANWLPAPVGPFSPLMHLDMPEERPLHPVHGRPPIRRVRAGTTARADDRSAAGVPVQRAGEAVAGTVAPGTGWSDPAGRTSAAGSAAIGPRACSRSASIR